MIDDSGKFNESWLLPFVVGLESLKIRGRLD